MIPSWLTSANPPASLLTGARRGKQGFLEKTIKAAAAFTAEVVLAGDSAQRRGFLQKIDPRFKLPGILALLLSISLVHSPWSICSFLLIALVLSFFSGIGPAAFTARVSPFIVLFGILPALPAVLNVITPGEPVIILADFGHAFQLGPLALPAVVTVTHEGLVVASVFASRVAASISLAVLLPLTTNWNQLLHALGVLRVPRLFIMVAAMSYRYMSLLVLTVAELHEARKSRTVRYFPMTEEQRWVASRMGFLFIKSYRLSQEVHNAMLARGFSGEVRILSPHKGAGRDVAFLLLVLLACTALVAVDHVGW